MVHCSSLKMGTRRILGEKKANMQEHSAGRPKWTGPTVGPLGSSKMLGEVTGQRMAAGSGNLLFGGGQALHRFSQLQAIGIFREVLEKAFDKVSGSLTVSLGQLDLS